MSAKLVFLENLGGVCILQLKLVGILLDISSRHIFNSKIGLPLGNEKSEKVKDSAFQDQNYFLDSKLIE